MHELFKWVPNLLFLISLACMLQIAFGQEDDTSEDVCGTGYFLHTSGAISLE